MSKKQNLKKTVSKTAISKHYEAGDFYGARKLAQGASSTAEAKKILFATAIDPQAYLVSLAAGAVFVIIAIMSTN